MQAARGTPLTSAVPRRPLAFLAATATAVLAADVATKAWAVARLPGREVGLLGGHVVLHVQRNPGAAFSLAGGATVLFTLLAIGVVVVIVRAARRLASTAWGVTLGLLLAGATGNLVDRMLRDPGPFRGHVVDFVDLQWNGRSVWPVFNVADMAIVTGGLLALLLTWRGIPLKPGDTEP
ncbi:MAG TPA: signal peptidase II [Mycobacteriales bacterium]|nr:signal peptidase II [Mycobacteriales bacterium]